MNRNTVTALFLILAASAALIAGCSAPQPVAAPQSVSSQQSQQFTQQVTTEQAVQKNTKTYTNEKYGISLEYPATWEVRDRNNDGTGVIITAADKDDEWGGTNLNMNFEWAVGDVGMGSKQFKSEELINPQGVKFFLGFMTADVEFAKEYDVKYDLDDISVVIGNDDIPGLMMFGYNQKTNPDGERQLKEILNSVKLMKVGQN